VKGDGMLIIIRHEEEEEENMTPAYSHAAVLELSVGERDEAGGDVPLVVGQLLHAAAVVAAPAAGTRAADAARQTAAATDAGAVAVAVTGLGHCNSTHTPMLLLLLFVIPEVV